MIRKNNMNLMAISWLLPNKILFAPYNYISHKYNSLNNSNGNPNKNKKIITEDHYEEYYKDYGLVRILPDKSVMRSMKRLKILDENVILTSLESSLSPRTFIARTL